MKVIHTVAALAFACATASTQAAEVIQDFNLTMNVPVLLEFKTPARKDLDKSVVMIYNVETGLASKSITTALFTNDTEAVLTVKLRNDVVLTHQTLSAETIPLKIELGGKTITKNGVDFTKGDLAVTQHKSKDLTLTFSPSSDSKFKHTGSYTGSATLVFSQSTAKI